MKIQRIDRGALIIIVALSLAQLVAYGWMRAGLVAVTLALYWTLGRLLFAGVRHLWRKAKARSA